MSKKMMKRLATAVSLTSVANQAAVRMNESPLLGGGGMGGVSGGARNALLQLAAAPGGAASVLLQGHDAVDPPASGDSGWYTIATITSATPLLTEVELAPWMRIRVDVVGTGTLTADLIGVQ